MWIKILFSIIIALVVLMAVILGYGSYRWDKGTRALRANLEASRVPSISRVVDFSEIDSLPAPVRRYFRSVLKNGQPMIAGAMVRHRGSFNMGEAKERWKSFTSSEKVITMRPGFDWDARIVVMPGVQVRVHDAYVAGEGILHAALFGIFSLVDLKGMGVIAEGELMRFLAEAVWYPTALLPGGGVSWEAIDDRSALATLTDGSISLSLLFSFDERGLIDTVRAKARGRMVDGKIVQTAWMGRLWNYEEREGMMVPLDGEVAWLLEGVPRPYWRGHITEVEYEFER